MLNLSLTTDKISLITSSSADIAAHASWVDDLIESAGPPRVDVFTAGKTNTAIASATTTDIVASPAASTVRNIKFLSFRNKHATTANDLTVQFNANATLYELIKVTLAAGELLVRNDAGVWFVYDINGGVKMGASAASDTVAGLIAIATQADQETATSLVLAVTPGRQHFHPSAAKWWAKVGLTGNVLASYNVTSVADTGTGAITVTIATDFSSVHWCAGGIIELASTVIAQSCTYDSMTAGTIIFRSVVEAGSATDPATWSVFGFGDL